MATGHKTCRGKGDDACDSLLRHVMSRVWRPESGTACCWLHPAKVKIIAGMLLAVFHGVVAERPNVLPTAAASLCQLGNRARHPEPGQPSQSREGGTVIRASGQGPLGGSRIPGRRSRAQTQFPPSPPNGAVKIPLSGRSRTAKPDHCSTDVEARPNPEHKAKGARPPRKRNLRHVGIRLGGPSARIAANRRHHAPPLLCMK